MKVLRMLFAGVMCVCFTSCLEINEEVQINENGAGSYSSTIDMAQLIDMMQAMGGEEFEKKKDEKIDSVIYMKDIVDTSTRLTSEQKALLRDGTMRIKMNMAEKEFLLRMNYPFSSLEKLQQLNNQLGNSGAGFGSLMKGMGGAQPGAEQQPGSGDNEMDQLLGAFDYNIKNGSIEKKLNKDKLQKILDNPKMAEMKQGADMGIEVLYNVTYKLPRPAKSVSNAKAKLSDDKRTVTIRNNLMEIFTKAESFEYKIEY